MNNQLSRLLLQANLAFQDNDLATTKTIANKILNIKTDQLDALSLLLQIANIKKDYNSLEKYSELILTHDKNNKNALIGKLHLLELKELYFDAIKITEQLLTIEPSNLTFLYKKSLNEIKTGKILNAEKGLNLCNKHNLKEPFLLLNLGHVYKAKGNSKKASELYLQFINENPKRACVGYWSLADLKDYHFSIELLLKMKRIMIENQYSSGNKSLLLFAISRANEQLSNIKEAFESISKANEMMLSYKPFEARLYSNLTNDFVNNLTIKPNIDSFNSDFTPIFIVGMPRSGTTLIEQILASHSQVEATDELPYIERLAMKLEPHGGYVSNLSKISTHEANQLSLEYKGQVSQYFSSLPTIAIDKNPNNFIHIALIKSIFPNAKIINVLRNPLDNALSVFKQYFSNGHNYSYSLPNIIFYWQEYLKLMAHWDTVFPNQIHHISYEQLVANSEEETTSLLQYCELKFEANCMTFYKSDKPVLTPSVSQVRQPINSKSINSWQKYEPYITEFLPHLEQIALNAKQLYSNSRRVID